VTLPAPGAPPTDDLVNARDADEVRARYAQRYPGAALEVAPFDFEAWKEKARGETRKAIEAFARGKDYDFKDAVWGALKRYLFDLFDGKCAYCECDIRGRSPGAVEHYRPKSAYYWLAYDCHNYLPACTPCNTYKGSAFPVEDEKRRVQQPPADPFDRTPLEAERPMLFHLLFEDPFPGSLKFEIFRNAAGIPTMVFARPLDKRAASCIETLKLNRPDLSEKRAEEVRQALRSYGLDYQNGRSEFIAAVKEARVEFSAAAWTAIAEENQRRAEETAIPRTAAAGGR
jgi:uncharacterized protein (TIGR02646 family)